MNKIHIIVQYIKNNNNIKNNQQLINHQFNFMMRLRDLKKIQKNKLLNI